jgi:hypothetical protein
MRRHAMPLNHNVLRFRTRWLRGVAAVDRELLALETLPRGELRIVVAQREAPERTCRALSCMT